MGNMWETVMIAVSDHQAAAAKLCRRVMAVGSALAKV